MDKLHDTTRSNKENMTSGKEKNGEYRRTTSEGSDSQFALAVALSQHVHEHYSIFCGRVVRSPYFSASEVWFGR